MGDNCQVSIVTLTTGALSPHTDRIVVGAEHLIVNQSGVFIEDKAFDRLIEVPQCRTS